MPPVDEVDAYIDRASRRARGAALYGSDLSVLLPEAEVTPLFIRCGDVCVCGWVRWRRRAWRAFGRPDVLILWPGAGSGTELNLLDPRALRAPTAKRQPPASSLRPPTPTWRLALRSPACQINSARTPPSLSPPYASLAPQRPPGVGNSYFLAFPALPAAVVP